MTKITLCGSTKFMDKFNEMNVKLTLRGHTVYSVATSQKSNTEITDDDKLRLDAVHMAKILNSDEILVLNVDGYIGESTKREIYFAEAVGKRVTYLEAPYRVHNA